MKAKTPRFLAEQFLLRRAAVLCARRRSVYHEFSGVDVYCTRRDAFTFTGSCPVVAHPPCARWGRLRQFTRETSGADFERYLGRFCVDQVRHYGGVLEHPASSTLWADQGLPRPGQYSPEGCTIAVPQYWFGHRAIKATWLFVARLQPRDIPPPPLRLESDDVVPVVRMSRWEREHTPRDLAAWLIELAVLSGDRDRYHWGESDGLHPRYELAKSPRVILKDRPREIQPALF